MNVNFIGMTPYFCKRTEEQAHPFWEILYYLHGSGTLSAGGEIFDFEEGDIILQAPYTKHQEFSKDGFINIYVQIPRIESFGKKTLQIRDYPNKDIIGKIFEQMHNTYHKQQYNWNILVQSFFDVIYQNLISGMGTTPRNEFVEKIENRILSNITNTNFNVQHEIDKLPISSDHFRKIFKNETGSTPLQYLIEKRVSFATNLLDTKENSNMTIKQIAYNAGFEDQYYFSRVFKKIMGKSPINY